MNYSRFDHIDTDSEEDERTQASSVSASAALTPPIPINASGSTGPAASSPPAQGPPVKMTSKGQDGRLKFEYEGRTIYEWEQSLEEVRIH